MTMTAKRRLPSDVLLLAGLFLVGLLVRLPSITRSLGHDEVYT